MYLTLNKHGMKALPGKSSIHYSLWINGSKARVWDSIK
jgi:hypothetical protein